MKNACYTVLFYYLTLSTMAQEKPLPFAEIPPAPHQYTLGNVIARTVEGLGFRYYWATEGLQPNDLAYKPSPQGKTTLETLAHLYSLAETICNVSLQKSNVRPPKNVPTDLTILRTETLQFLKTAAERFRSTAAEKVETWEIRFDRQGETLAFPLWHLLNGPLADALYHTGQVVSFRRSSGNPIPAGVNVFMGTKEP